MCRLAGFVDIPLNIYTRMRQARERERERERDLCLSCVGKWERGILSYVKPKFCCTHVCILWLHRVRLHLSFTRGKDENDVKAMAFKIFWQLKFSLCPPPPPFSPTLPFISTPSPPISLTFFSLYASLVKTSFQLFLPSVKTFSCTKSHRHCMYMYIYNWKCDIPER